MKLCIFAFGFKASFLEDFKLICIGRSPDLSPFWTAFPFLFIGTVAMGLPKRCTGLTVAGLFRIFT